jgi:hypothetical protein
MLRALWNRRRRESELEDEIAFHLSEEADERRIAGDAPADAIVAARRDFGNARHRRDHRDPERRPCAVGSAAPVPGGGSAGDSVRDDACARNLS